MKSSPSNANDRAASAVAVARGRAHSEGGRRLGLGGCLFAVLAAQSLVPACRAPTQVTVEVVGEVPFREGMSVAVQVARAGDVEAAPLKSVTSARWAFGQTIGTVVVAPGEQVTEADVRIVLALGRAPESCTRDDAAGCVVYRRRVAFDGASVVRAVLRSSCFGVYCDETTSCRDDRSCGTMTSDEPARPAERAEGSDTYAAVVLADGPRHYYRFGEPEGAKVARDEMKHADGTYEGVRLGITGAIASATGAAYFDGVRARVLVPRLEELPGALTLEAWVRVDGDELVDPVILQRIDARSSGSLFGYRLSLPSKRSVKLELFREAKVDLYAVPSDAPLPSDGFGFMHVAAIADRGQIKVYLDGVLARQETYPDGPLPPSGVPLLIGAGTSTHFRGAMDELAIYDHALDVGAVRRHVEAAKRR